MKNFSWNRRDFIAKPATWFAGLQLFNGSSLLFGQTAKSDASSQIIHRTLGKTGLSLPIVSMGVMNADVPGLIPRSYQLGVRHFDTAAHYQEGRNESMVGAM